MSYHLLTIETHQLTIVKDLQQKFFQKSFLPLTIETLKAFRQGARHTCLGPLTTIMQKHLQDVCLNVGGIRGARLHDAPGPQRCTVFCQGVFSSPFNHLTSALSPLIIIIDTLLPETQKQTIITYKERDDCNRLFLFFTHAGTHTHTRIERPPCLTW